MNKIPIILTLCLFSYNDDSSHVKETRITLYYNSLMYTTIICDSATQVSDKEAIYWANGFKGTVIATNYLTISRY